MKTPGVEIRQLGIDDLHAVFVIGKEIYSGNKSRFPRGWDEKILAEILADNLDLSLIALRKKKPVGFLIGAVEEGKQGEGQAMIAWLGVRGGESRDLGPLLIESFIAACAERNIEKIRIEVSGSDDELIEICGKSGFTQKEQVLIMERFSGKK